jgi:hypothetical protein
MAYCAVIFEYNFTLAIIFAKGIAGKKKIETEK